jgi:putative ATP-dependent endonuclease of OLD family
MADGHIDVRGHLVLVGPNDSGKSSILRGIHLCLGVPTAQLTSSIQVRDLTSVDEPLVFEVTLDGFSEEERAAFPDEIDVGPPETLTIRLEARADDEDPTVIVAERRFPFGGHSRNISRIQLAAIAWRYVPATRSLLRELGGTAGGAAQNLLSGLDLSEDEVAFDGARDSYRSAIAGSASITEFRATLAGALTASLPDPVGLDDVGVSLSADLLDDPLSNVAVTLREQDHMAPITEQSDGVRALSVLALLGLAHGNAQIVAIDEPEIHLHATAQRAVADNMRRSLGQRVVSTHSGSIVSRMDPLDIAAFGADRRVRQLPAGAHFSASEVSARHWGQAMIEPLTARRIAVVEGVSDRIVLARAAELLGLDLDRLGVAIFELDGAELFPLANKLFGKPGFDLPLYGLVDSDAADSWAQELGVNRGQLEAAGIVESVPDLEAAYVDALGVARVVGLLDAAMAYSQHQVLSSAGVPDLQQLTDAKLAAFCRMKRHKTRVAIAVSHAMTALEARSIDAISRLLNLLAT